MISKSMDWNEKAYRALIKAFSPMPPHIREKALQKVIDKIESYARNLGAKRVEFEHVYKVSKELLMSKERYMYESLINSLKSEGFRVEEL